MRRFIGFLIIIAVAGMIVAVIGVVPGFKGMLQREGGVVTAPLDQGARKSEGFFGTMVHLFRLGTDNDALRAEVQNLKSQLIGLRELQLENEALRTQLGFANEMESQLYTPARVIGRSPTALLDAVVVNRGQRDGVRIGQGVVWNGYLVGRVRSVSQTTSDIELVTDRNFVVPIVLQQSRGTGVLRGTLAGATVDDIPLDTPITVGEAVLTSGLGGELPPNLPVGEVESVISSPSDIFQRIKMRVPFQARKLEIVFIVVPKV